MGAYKETEVLKTWSDKWNKFIQELNEGEQKLKLIVDFEEEGIEFLSNIQFTTAFWYDNNPDSFNAEFDVDFSSGNNNFSVTGNYGIKMNISPEPPVNSNKLFELFNRFKLNEMISEIDPYGI